MDYISHYTVTNNRTGKVTEFKTSTAASKSCDRQDMAYGAICTTRRAHWVAGAALRQLTKGSA